MELDFVASEDEIGGYTPLERPSCSTVPIPQASRETNIVYSEEESNESSSEDSDGGRIVKDTRKRKSIQNKHVPNPNVTKKAKFTIWSDILQEDAIENDFNGSKFFSNSRGNETYNYRMKYFSNHNEPFAQDGMNEKNTNKGFSKKNKSFKNPLNKGKHLKKSLLLPELNVTETDSDEIIANAIAQCLNEPKSELIVRVVQVLGRKRAIKLYNETKKIEEKGGYLTCDRSRRRTSGGVYLKIVKNYKKMSREEQELIFNMNERINSFQDSTKDVIMSDESEPLPTRAELELALGMEENETNILKNPPPSPVHPTASLSTSPCSLPFVFPGASSDSTGSTSPTNNHNTDNSEYFPTSPTHSPPPPSPNKANSPSTIY